MAITTQDDHLRLINETRPAVAWLGLRACDSTAEQCHALGLAVGDTIEGREEAPRGYWHEVRLTLLWLGQEVAVWSQTERSSERPEWSDPEECADWTLECRQWRKVAA